VVSPPPPPPPPYPPKNKQHGYNAGELLDILLRFTRHHITVDR
jgi:hypothetical protein